MDAPDETSRAPSQEPENPNCYLVHSLLNTIPVTELESPVLPEDSPVVTSQTLVYSTVLDPLEQNLILRYLHSRCHSWNRLQTEGYVLGSGPHEVKRTPSKASIEIYDFRSPPHTNIQAAGRINAIAIDCEMVGVRKGCQTLAFISAINFLTGEVLISRFVDPVEDVVDWRTKFSGITKTIMASAIISGAAFRSWREARDKLWEYMDDSTILVGHSLNHDLEVLGMFHAKVVDSAILTAETVFPSIIPTKRLTRMWGLKRLAKDLLNLDIQTSNRGHNALEDSYAARDIVIWCIRNPEELKLWAENARHQEEERKAAQSRNRHGKGRSKGKLPTIRSTQNWEYDSENDDYSEGFRLSDLAEELGWPQGYDPWSD
ncbi:hypothetical protein PENANT_c001G03490 [Penicillium antarcticum]|uniref:Exonuclease domain-containing protein n=1 Tax=Penicillium antarcticum TaxID=416450 RepID=A0A1V6QMJ1_9EURO|nr:uncharacterized protein N7508_010500 [Penicillium antarcticum]KAJ5295679.1 hypothetical protein N7508_010500 [Penicillium antarcticum]OQD90478.1 hypothetical protein PENANT_c001G03490 [Penicillium antarcticum]